MKIFLSVLLLVTCLGGSALVRAQDSATEERLNKLTGQIEDLLAAKAEQDKRIAALVKEIESLREQLIRPNASYAGTEDVRKLAELVKEVDQKRIEDNKEILRQIELIGKAASGGRNEGRSGSKRGAPSGAAPKSGNAGTTGGSETGFEHEIATGDTLSTIAEAYRAKGVKVTVEQILQANPGLKERSLQVGQKVFIPAAP